MKITNEQLDELFRAIDYKEILRSNSELKQYGIIESALKFGKNEIDIEYTFIQDDEPLSLISCRIDLIGWIQGMKEIVYFDKHYFKALETKLWIDSDKYLNE